MPYAANTTETLTRNYEYYTEAREKLHFLEQMEAEQTALDTAYANTLMTKELFANEAIKLHEKVPESGKFLQMLANALTDESVVVEECYRMGSFEPLMASYILPLSTLRSDVSNPIEAAVTTVHNLDLLEEFTVPLHNYAKGMLLSGANAYGAFYAVRGGVPSSLTRLGVPQLSHSERSDIDILVSTADIHAIGQCIEAYIMSGVISVNERKRYLKFLKLFEKGEADIFSLRSYYEDVEQSVHFMTKETVSSICNLQPIRNHIAKDGLNYSIVRDFRPNIPGNVRKYGAYPINDLLGLKQEHFSPSIQRIGSTDSGYPDDYLCENTVGGPAVIGHQRTYYMGVFSFFLSVGPVVLIDRDGEFSADISKLQNNISLTLDGKKPTNIPRQEHMTRASLSKILSML